MFFILYFFFLPTFDSTQDIVESTGILIHTPTYGTVDKRSMPVVTLPPDGPNVAHSSLTPGESNGAYFGQAQAVYLKKFSDIYYLIKYLFVRFDKKYMWPSIAKLSICQLEQMYLLKTHTMIRVITITMSKVNEFFSFLVMDYTNKRAVILDMPAGNPISSQAVELSWVSAGDYVSTQKQLIMFF